MSHADTELLFPLRVANSLGNMRGSEWHDLIIKVTAPNAPLPDQISFVLMMVRLTGCVSCNADSFRAMKGCTQCACQVIRRFRGNDKEILTQFSQAQADVKKYMDRLG